MDIVVIQMDYRSGQVDIGVNQMDYCFGQVDLVATQMDERFGHVDFAATKMDYRLLGQRFVFAIAGRCASRGYFKKSTSHLRTPRFE